MAIWGIFLNTTLQAAVHLGQDYEANLRYVENHFRNSVGQLFYETGKLIREQPEITGVNTIKFKELAWMSASSCAKELIRSPSRNLFLLRLCVLWDKWEMILLRLGRAKLNGFRKTMTSRI